MWESVLEIEFGYKLDGGRIGFGCGCDRCKTDPQLTHLEIAELWFTDVEAPDWGRLIVCNIGHINLEMPIKRTREDITNIICGSKGRSGLKIQIYFLNFIFHFKLNVMHDHWGKKALKMTTESFLYMCTHNYYLFKKIILFLI